jgi:multidrug efflux pump subunit AcrA (membrane-fusion protein)
MKHLAFGLILYFAFSLFVSPPQIARAENSPPAIGAEDASGAADAGKEAKKKKKKGSKKKAKKKDGKKAEKPKKDDGKKKDVKKPVAKKADAKKADAKKAPVKKPVTPPKKVTPKKPKLPVYEVEKGPFRIFVNMKGAFQAKKTVEISIEPEQWSGFKVLRAVKHGKHVKKGDMLVTFDPERIDKAIKDLRRQVKLNDISMRGLQEEIKAHKKLDPMDKKALERRERMAKEDYEQTKKVDIPMYKESAKLYLKAAEEELAYAKEELEQLEKMYKADELTDETEEIILRRARFQVRYAEFYHKMSKMRYEETMKFSLPRQVEYLEDSMIRAELSMKKAKIMLPLSWTKQKIAWERARLASDELKKKLKELVEDRKFMTVKAPTSGIVFYGECKNGRWTGMTSAKSFDEGSAVPPKRVFMTIVKQGPLVIETGVSEKEIRLMREGMKGQIQPTAYPNERLDTVVSEVDAMPTGGTQFGVKLLVTDAKDVNVVPGMTCSIKLVACNKKNALTIPPSALGIDPLDGTKTYVYVVDDKGDPKKRMVKLGERTSKEIEILKGLKVGDKVLKVCLKEADILKKKRAEAKKKAEEAKKKAEEAKKKAEEAKKKAEADKKKAEADKKKASDKKTKKDKKAAKKAKKSKSKK